MNIQRLRELIAPYRREAPVFIPATIQCDDVVVCPYPAGFADRKIGPVAALSVSHLPTIRQLVALLSREHRQQHNQLSACLLQMQSLLTKVINTRYTDHVGEILLVSLDAFDMFLQFARQQVHERLLSNLQALTIDECFCATAFIGAEDIDAAVQLVKHVNDEYQRFYEEMSTVLYCGEGLTRCRGDNLQLQEELAGMLMLVERSVLLETSLRVALQHWKDKIALQEVQVLLN